MKIKITLIDIIRKDMTINKIIEKKIHVRISNQSQKIFNFFYFLEKQTHTRIGEMILTQRHVTTLKNVGTNYI